MKDSADLRELLLAYRLGELSPEDREQLDERIICDQDFSDRIAETAYDLLDDYRAGRLERTQRQRVKKAFPQAELRSGSAPGFDLSRTARPASSATWRWFPLWVASLAFVSAGLLLFFIHLHKAQAPVSVAASRPAEKSGPQVSVTNSAPPSGSGSSPSTQSSNHLLAILLLQPSVARGGATSVLELEPSMQVVRVQWVIPDGVTARAFTLSVTREGAILKTIAQRRNLRKIGGHLEAEFDLAPGIFAKSPEDAHFLFVVSAGDRSHTAVGEYPVLVRARP
jgi:hypothetical protein